MLTLPSFTWPGATQFLDAETAFDLCCIEYEIEQKFSGEGEAGDEDLATEDAPTGSLENWRAAMRSGTPDSVRSNVWLLLWWAQRSFRYECPVGYWLGMACVGLVALQACYGVIRSALAMVIAMV